MLGLILIILWPIMGLASFLAAVAWFSVCRPSRLNVQRSLGRWIAIALGLSVVCVFVDAMRIFIIPGSGWPDFFYYGSLMIWPLPIGILLARGVVAIWRKAFVR